MRDAGRYSTTSIILSLYRCQSLGRIELCQHRQFSRAGVPFGASFLALGFALIDSESQRFLQIELKRSP